MSSEASVLVASWHKKIALSLGTAAAVALLVRQLRRATTSSCSAVKTLLVSDVTDSKGQAAATLAIRECAAGAKLITPNAIDDEELDTYTSIVIFCSDVKRHQTLQLDTELLQKCLSKLGPDGLITAHLGEVSQADATRLDVVGLFAGAVDSEVSNSSSLFSSGVRFCCKRPPWAQGAASEIKRIDEDALLGEVPQPVGKGKSDCSTQPKACANCSCGRKELEDKHGAEEATKRLEQGKERSACGSCYLGDAFRCDSCPYRGLPAFKPGAKVELSGGETVGTGQLGVKVEASDTIQTHSDGKLLIAA
jgi:hypothetical protein